MIIVYNWPPSAFLGQEFLLFDSNALKYSRVLPLLLPRQLSSLLMLHAYEF